MIASFGEKILAEESPEWKSPAGGKPASRIGGILDQMNELLAFLEKDTEGKADDGECEDKGSGAIHEAFFPRQELSPFPAPGCAGKRQEPAHADGNGRINVIQPECAEGPTQKNSC